MLCLLAKSGGHLVGECSSNDHAIGLARAGPEDDSKPIKIVAGGTSVHHLDGAAREPERHGPDRPAAGPVHEVVDLRDHVLGGLRDPRRGWGRRRGGAGVLGGGGGGGGEGGEGGVEGDYALGREDVREARGGSAHEGHCGCRAAGCGGSIRNSSFRFVLRCSYFFVPSVYVYILLMNMPKSVFFSFSFF